MEPMVVERGERVPLSRNAFEQDGYEFSGWNLKADGSGRGYGDGREVIGGFDGTLYAQWREAVEPGMTVSPAPAEGARTEETAPAGEEPPVEEPRVEEAATEPAPEETGETYLLVPNDPGAYGMTFTNYGGGSVDDTSEIMGWFVPAGPYTVSAIRTDGPRLAVWYGTIEPSVNGDGVPETMGFQCARLAQGEFAEIVVPQGGCVYITGTRAQVKHDRHEQACVWPWPMEHRRARVWRHRRRSRASVSSGPAEGRGRVARGSRARRQAKSS
jgi:hypothetical protein